MGLGKGRANVQETIETGGGLGGTREEQHPIHILTQGEK